MFVLLCYNPVSFHLICEATVA